MKLNFLKLKQFQSANALMDRIRTLLSPSLWIGVSRQKRRGEDVIQAIEALGNHLTEVGKRFEPHFMDLGSQLQTAFTDARRLTEYIQESVQHIGSKDGEDFLAGVTGLAESSMAELKRCRTDMTGSLESVNTCIHQLQALNTQTTAIEKIALFLKVIGFNIAVESSRSAEGLNMFSVVATDVTALSDEIHQTVAKLCQSAEESIKIQQVAYQEVIGGFQAASQLADGAQKSILDTASDARKLMEMTVDAMTAAQRHSQTISEQVAQVVTGIQFHDSMNQRLEHMVAALTDLTQRYRKAPANANGQPGKADRLAEARRIIELQHAQLGQVIVEAQNVHQNNKTAFQTIYEQIDRMVEGIASFGTPEMGITNGTGRNSDAFQNLINALSTLHSLLNRGAAMIDQVRGSLSEADDSAVKLAEEAAAVRRISHAIHLLALNAIVKAAHMGEQGSTLEVLAQQVRTLSHNANDFVDQFQRLLDAVTAASANARSAEQQPDDPSSCSREAKDLIGRQIEQIAGAYEHFQGGTKKTVTAAGELKQHIETIQYHLNFFTDLDSALLDHHRKMASVLADLIPWSKAGTAASEPITPGLSERYTMDQERLVHEQVLKAPTPATENQLEGFDAFETSASGTDTSSEVPSDDNDMEWFDDFGQDDSTVEADPDALAGQAVSHPEKAAAEPGEKEEFGENIELF